MRCYILSIWHIVSDQEVLITIIWVTIIITNFLSLCDGYFSKQILKQLCEVGTISFSFNRWGTKAQNSPSSQDLDMRICFNIWHPPNMRRGSDNNGRRELTNILFLCSISRTIVQDQVTTSSCLVHGSHLLSWCPISTINCYSPFFTQSSQPSRWPFNSWATQWYAPLRTLHSLPLHLEWNPHLYDLANSANFSSFMLWHILLGPVFPCHTDLSPVFKNIQTLSYVRAFLHAVPSALVSILYPSELCSYFSTPYIPIFYISTPSFYPSLISQLRSIFICFDYVLTFSLLSPTKLEAL